MCVAQSIAAQESSKYCDFVKNQVLRLSIDAGAITPAHFDFEHDKGYWIIATTEADLPESLPHEVGSLLRISRPAKLSHCKGETEGAWVAQYRAMRFACLESEPKILNELYKLDEAYEIRECGAPLPLGLVNLVDHAYGDLCSKSASMESTSPLANTCRVVSEVFRSPSMMTRLEQPERQLADAIVKDVISYEKVRNKEVLRCGAAIQVFEESFPPGRTLEASWLALRHHGIVPLDPKRAESVMATTAFACAISSRRRELDDAFASWQASVSKLAEPGVVRPEAIRLLRSFVSAEDVPSCYADILPGLAAVVGVCDTKTSSRLFDVIAASQKGDAEALTRSLHPMAPLHQHKERSVPILKQSFYVELAASLRLLYGYRRNEPHAMLPVFAPVGFALRHKSLYLEIAPLELGQYATSNGNGGFRRPRAFDGFAPNLTFGLSASESPSWILGLSAGLARLESAPEFFVGINVGPSFNLGRLTAW